jgi:hypothetical protein
MTGPECRRLNNILIYDVGAHKGNDHPEFHLTMCAELRRPVQLMTAPPGSPISHPLRGGLKIAPALSTNEKPARRLLQIPRQDLCFSRSVTTRGPEGTSHNGVQANRNNADRRTVHKKHHRHRSSARRGGGPEGDSTLRFPRRRSWRFRPMQVAPLSLPS